MTGDTVLTEALTYPGVKRLAEWLHLRLEGVAMDAEGLRPDALAAACRRKDGGKLLYTMPTLQNPTGAVMSEERRRQIASVVKEHGLTVLEDDAYGRLLETPPRPLAAFAPEQTYFVAGTAKVLAPGLRIAYLAAPTPRVEKLAHGIWMSNVMATPVTAEVAARWIEDGTAEKVVELRRHEARARWKLVRSILGIRGGREVGMHFWLPLPAGWRAEAFAAQAHRAGVSVMPAETFAVGPAAAPAGVRVCLGPPRTRDALEQGLRRLAAALETGPAPLPAIV